VKELPKNNEGVVVCDRNWNRVKIKCDEYIRLHSLIGNGFTEKGLWNCMMDGSIDDILGNFPEYNEFYKTVIVKKNNDVIDKLIDLAKIAYSFIDFNIVDERERKKNYAMKVQNEVEKRYNSWMFIAFNKIKDQYDGVKFISSGDFMQFTIEYLKDIGFDKYKLLQDE
jgi:hypothetical protein